MILKRFTHLLFFPAITLTILALVVGCRAVKPTAAVKPSAPASPSAPTATKQATLTPPISSPPPYCPRPADLAETKVAAMLEPFFCVVWVDEFDDETEFHIRITYSTGEVLERTVAADYTQLMLTDLDSMHYDEAQGWYKNRTGYEVLVSVARAGEEILVGGTAFDVDVIPPSMLSSPTP